MRAAKTIKNNKDLIFGNYLFLKNLPIVLEIFLNKFDPFGLASI